MSKPLHIVFSGRLAERIRDVARGQNVTYASLCRAALMHMVAADGTHVITCAWGDPDFTDCQRIEEEEEEV